jgi:hypothetical protein
MQKWFMSALLLAFFPGMSRPQMIGNPLLSPQAGKMTVSVESGYQRWTIQNVYNDIQPLGLKIGYAPVAGVNAFVRLGIARLKMPWGSTPETTFDGDYRFAGGLGLTWQPLKLGKRSGIFANAQAWRLTSEGQYLSENLAGTTLRKTRLSEFDWRTFLLAAGVSREIKKNRFYLGVEMAATERIENRRDKDVSEAGATLQETQRQLTLQTGTLFRAFWGFEVALPNQHHISLEVRSNGMENWIILFGLSQTGSPK